MKKLFFLLIIFVGCSDPPQIKHYTIKVVGPNNQQRIWNVESYQRPVIITHFGGQLSVQSPDTKIYWWEREIVAPTGWNLIIEERDNGR